MRKKFSDHGTDDKVKFLGNTKSYFKEFFEMIQQF